MYPIIPINTIGPVIIKSENRIIITYLPDWIGIFSLCISYRSINIKYFSYFLRTADEEIIPVKFGSVRNDSISQIFRIRCPERTFVCCSLNGYVIISLCTSFKEVDHFIRLPWTNAAIKILNRLSCELWTKIVIWTPVRI